MIYPPMNIHKEDFLNLEDTWFFSWRGCTYETST